MEQKWGFSLRGPVTSASKKYKVKRKHFCLLPLAFCLFLLAGCGDHMARMDENQIKLKADQSKLQTLAKANARQIADIAARLEQNQQELYVVIEHVQNDVAKVAIDVAAVAEAQMKLREVVQSGSRQASEEMVALEQNQQDMSASLSRAIAGVQDETRKVALDVTAVTAEQAKLYETVRVGNAQLTDKVAAMEQTQQERQDTIGGMQENIQAVAASISALGEDTLRLQEILQNNIRELVSLADISGKKQIEFHQNMSRDIQTLDEALASLKASQNTLQSRIQDMQSNAPDYSNVPAALEKLKASQSALQNRIEQMQNNAPDFSDVPAALDQLRVSQSALQSRIEQMQNDAPDFSDVPAALDQLRDQLEELSRSSAVDEVGSTEYEAPPQANNIE